MADLMDQILYTDSAVVANQFNGIWQCRNRTLVPLLMTLEDIRSEYKFRIVQVPRSFVWEADALASAFLDQLAIRKKNIT
jgi:ribonuclease HI